jgi:hypothetical protein
VAALRQLVGQVQELWDLYGANAHPLPRWEKTYLPLSLSRSLVTPLPTSPLYLFLSSLPFVLVLPPPSPPLGARICSPSGVCAGNFAGLVSCFLFVDSLIYQIYPDLCSFVPAKKFRPGVRSLDATMFSTHVFFFTTRFHTRTRFTFPIPPPASANSPTRFACFARFGRPAPARRGGREGHAVRGGNGTIP